MGGLMSLAITILMDTLFAGASQGTWRDAIAKDLNTLLSLGLSSTSLIVNIVFVFVLGLMTAFGSFMGFIFSFFIYKFLQFLTNK
jgi:type IV secretory pathway VirB2 component (pilin)